MRMKPPNPDEPEPNILKKVGLNLNLYKLNTGMAFPRSQKFLYAKYTQFQ